MYKLILTTICLALFSMNLSGQVIPFSKTKSAITADVSGFKTTSLADSLQNKSYPEFIKAYNEKRRGEIDSLIDNFRTVLTDTAKSKKIKKAKSTLEQAKIAIHDKYYNLFAIAYEYYAAKNDFYQLSWKWKIIPCVSGLFPLRNNLISRYHYTHTQDRAVNALNSGSLLFNTAFDGKSIYTEAVSAYIPYARLSLGAMLSKTEVEELDLSALDTLTEESIEQARQEVQTKNAAKFTAQNLLAGGGNFLLNGSVPVFMFKSVSGGFNVSLSGYTRLGFALPEIGTTSDDLQLWYQHGVILDGRVDLGVPISEENSDGFDILGRFQFCQLYSKDVASTFNVDNGFFYGEVLVGLEFSNFRIAATFPRLFEHTKALKFEEAETINDAYFGSTISLTVVGI